VEQLDTDQGGCRRIRRKTQETGRARDPGPRQPGLIQTLLQNDLIDEFRVWIFPLVLGTGKRLFGEGALPVALKLVDSKVSKTGVTINTYERAGDIDVGSFEFDEPTEAEIERRQRLAAT
jgi:RibD C-terminal domain